MKKFFYGVIDKSRVLLTFFLFITPLFFTKNIVKDPYLIQDVLFSYGLFLVYLTSFIFFILNKKQIFFKSFIKIEKILFLFLALCFLSTFFEILKNKSSWLAIFLQSEIHFSWLISRVILIFFLHFIIQDKKIWTNVFKVIIFVGFLASIYGILQIFNIELFWNIDIKKFGNRSISTFGNPNFLSSYLVMVIPICYFFYKKTKKYIYLFILSILIFGLISTYTRSSWLGIFFAGIYFVVLYFKYFMSNISLDLKKYFKFKYLFLIFLIIFILLFSKDFKYRIKETFNLSKNNKSIYQRLIIYKIGFDIFKDNWIFGSGYGTFDLKSPFYIGKYIKTAEMYEHKTHANLAHNQILQVLSEIGIIGFLVYLYFWFLFFKICFFILENNKNYDEKFLVLLFSCSVFGMLIDNLLNVSMQVPSTMTLFWLIISIIIKIYKENYTFSENKTKIINKNFQIFFFVISIISSLIIIIKNTKFFISEKIFFNSVVLTCDKNLNKIPSLTLLKSKKYILESNKYWPYQTNKLYELARINQKLGFLDESINALNKAIKTHPGYSEFYLTNSVNYFKKNMFLEAKENLEIAEKIDPLNINILLLLYEVIKNENDYKKSIQILEKILIIEPKNPYIYNNLGVCYTYLNNFEKAKEFFLLAKKIDSKINLINENIEKVNLMQIGEFFNFDLV